MVVNSFMLCSIAYWCCLIACRPAWWYEEREGHNKSSKRDPQSFLFIKHYVWWLVIDIQGECFKHVAFANSSWSWTEQYIWFLSSSNTFCGTAQSRRWALEAPQFSHQVEWMCKHSIIYDHSQSWKTTLKVRTIVILVRFLSPGNTWSPDQYFSSMEKVK